MVINKEQFQENFKFFDKEIIVEIIDLFVDEFDERMLNLKSNIEASDMEQLIFHAHSLKGVISNFVAIEPREHVKALEEKAKEKDQSGLIDLYNKVYTSTSQLVEELKAIKVIYMD
jgi:HPt (histidine-containing phosphotransfer) domain-containing protein